MAWIPQGIDGVFFISVLTILSGSFGLAVRYCLKSKCEHFGICWGLFTIDRRVDLEVQEELAQMEMGIKDEVIIDDPIKRINNSPKPPPKLNLPKRNGNMFIKKDLEEKEDI